MAIGDKYNPQFYCDCIIDSIDDLNELIDHCNNLGYELFLQHPDLVRCVLNLVQEIQGFQSFKEHDYVFSISDILSIRMMQARFNDMYKRLLDVFCQVLDQYGGWLVGNWIDDDGIAHFLKCGYKGIDEDIDEEYLRQTNKKSLDARGETHSALCNIQSVVMGVLQEGRKIFESIVPDDTTTMHALGESLRDYARQVYEHTERDLRHEAQKFKERRNASLTPEVWGDVLENENCALELARDGKLTSEANIDDEHYEGFSDETKKQMEESYPLMQKILDIGMDDSLFDLEYGLESHVNLLCALNINNLDVFHELILRHNIIRCGAFPELRAEFESWIKGDEGKKEHEVVLSHNRQTIYDAVMKYIGKGDWKAPATVENVKQFMNVVLGREPQKLDAADRQMPEKLWSLFEHGRTGKNTRIEIAWANIVGFLSACNLLSGGSTVNNQKFFGQGKELISNIDHGEKMEGKALSELKPYLEKYCYKIIKGI